MRVLCGWTDISHTAVSLAANSISSEPTLSQLIPSQINISPCFTLSPETDVELRNKNKTPVWRNAIPVLGVKLKRE